MASTSSDILSDIAPEEGAKERNRTKAVKKNGKAEISWPIGLSRFRRDFIVGFGNGFRESHPLRQIQLVDFLAILIGHRESICLCQTPRIWGNRSFVLLLRAL